MTDLQKGDIVMNTFAGKGNPYTIFTLHWERRLSARKIFTQGL